MGHRLTVQFANLCRPPEVRRKFEADFVAALLNYQPDVEKLAWWQEHGHWEYLQARQRGVWTLERQLTEKERLRVVPIVRFEDIRPRR